MCIRDSCRIGGIAFLRRPFEGTGSDVEVAQQSLRATDVVGESKRVAPGSQDRVGRANARVCHVCGGIRNARDSRAAALVQKLEAACAVVVDVFVVGSRREVRECARLTFGCLLYTSRCV